jgi:ABC-type branched-subunit amino acid transport system ATPase component
MPSILRWPPASRVYILSGGRIGFEGTVAQLEAEDSLRREFFGLK